MRHEGIKFLILSHRFCGQPKLRKPRDITGVAPAFSVDYIPKRARCQVFVKEADAYIKHVDYFSPSLRDPYLIGTPLEVRAKKHLSVDRKKKFVYGDSWGDIVLRSEAWVKIEGLALASKTGFRPRIVLEIIRQQSQAHGWDITELMCTDMERFWERVVQGIGNL